MSSGVYASRWRWLFLAFALVIVAFIFRLAVNGIVEFRTIYLLMIPSVLAAALGGFWPAAITTCIAAALSVHNLSISGLTITDGLNAIIFMVIGFGIAWGGYRLRRARTETIRAMRNLAAREVYLRSILGTVPDALVVIDEDGIIQSFSTSAERLFQWRAKELKGIAVQTLLSGLLRSTPGASTFAERFNRGGYTSAEAIIGKRRDGTVFPAEVSINEMKLEGRSLFTLLIRDLTERHRTQERLRKLQASLAHMSRDRALGEMASTLAHELNQPLAAIANYLNGARRLLKETDTSGERVSSALGKATEQALRAGEIIRRVREFVTRGDVELSVIRLSQVIREAVMLAIVGYGGDGPEIHYDFSDDADRVFANDIQIQQVLVNLIRNAMDAMKQGGQRELFITTKISGDGMSVVSITDTGGGLTPEAAARLFQPFKSTKPGGMGIGLSISKTIIEAHGGRLWAENTDKGGAVFRFTLSRAQEMADAG